MYYLFDCGRYVIWPIEDLDAQEELDKVKKEMNSFLMSQFGEVELEPPRLTKYQLSKI